MATPVRRSEYGPVDGSHGGPGRFPGDVAQLVEHLLCKQGVGGSSPLVSTRKARSEAISGAYK